MQDGEIQTVAALPVSESFFLLSETPPEDQMEQR